MGPSYGMGPITKRRNGFDSTNPPFPWRAGAVCTGPDFRKQKNPKSDFWQFFFVSSSRLSRRKYGTKDKYFTTVKKKAIIFPVILT
jgi:hypothetical protein